MLPKNPRIAPKKRASAAGDPPPAHRPSHGEEGAGRNLGEKGVNKEERLRPATQQMPSPATCPATVRPTTLHMCHFFAHLPLISHHAPAFFFFSLFFLVFYLSFFILFLLVLFFFCFLSFLFFLLLANRNADFGQSKVQILSNRDNLIT